MAKHQLKRGEFGGVILTCSIGEQNGLEVYIPVIMVVVNELHYGSRQRLVHSFIKAIGLGVVRRTDPAVRATQLKQLLVNPVNEFSALVRHHNFRHSVSGDQVVQEIRHT